MDLAFRLAVGLDWLRCTALALAVFFSGLVSPVFACPFCGEKTRTLSELVAESDYVVLAQWASTTAESVPEQVTKYEIVQVVRDPGKAYKPAQSISFERIIPGKSGDLVLILGKRPITGKSELANWRDPIEMSEVAFQYVMQAPSPESPIEKRLLYFSRFLEYPDPVIAKDAYGEFANSAYKDIVPVARKLTPAQLRKWIFESDVQGWEMRRGIYGMMLGLCGDDSDASRLEAVIRENPTDKIRVGIDGMIGGYLLLKGADGLKLVEENKLAAEGIPFTETYAAMTALRFMWTYGDGRIPAARLKEALRVMLKREDVAELAITDLARWKDWEIQKRLYDLYGSDGEYGTRRLKKAIIGFMVASIRDVPKGKVTPVNSEKTPEHVLQGRKYLEELRKEDPHLVKEVEKFFR